MYIVHVSIFWQKMYCFWVFLWLEIRQKLRPKLRWIWPKLRGSAELNFRWFGRSLSVCSNLRSTQRSFLTTSYKLLMKGVWLCIFLCKYSRSLESIQVRKHFINPKMCFHSIYSIKLSFYNSWLVATWNNTFNILYNHIKGLPCAYDWLCSC